MIVDAKRGDIGSTSAAYAEAWLHARDGEPPVADAMTVNPYMGGDALEPFLVACSDGAGLFVLARTSNPGGADIQEQPARRRRAGVGAHGGAGGRLGRAVRGSCGLSQRRRGGRGDSARRRSRVPGS